MQKKKEIQKANNNTGNVAGKNDTKQWITLDGWKKGQPGSNNTNIR